MKQQAHPFLVAGTWKHSLRSVEKRNPYDGSLNGEYCLASERDADEAVLKAVEGFNETKLLPSHRRAEILLRIAEGLRSKKESLAESVTREVGKTLQFARVEIDRAVTTFQLAAEEAKRIGGEVLPLDLNAASEGRFGVVRRFPIGVVLAVCPFNYPVNLAAHKIAPAIAAGNAVILKPPPQAPGSAAGLARVIEESGFPANAFSLLPCENDVAEKLVRDERIAMLSFTGSAAVGWKLKSLAGKKKVVLELGGNAGAIIDESADLEDAVRRNVTGSFVYSGQVCIKVQRILIHEKIFDQYAERFVQAVKQLKVGDPMEEGMMVGPLIDDSAAERVERWINEAVRAGAKILTGGSRKERIIEPTVLAHVDRSSSVYCEEVFGPVVTLLPFRTFDDAVREVNNSRFGLQAGVFSNDHRNIMKAFQRIEAGAVVVNDNPTYRIDHMPYGGIKDSGFGREGLKYAVESMTEPKLLVLGSS